MAANPATDVLRHRLQQLAGWRREYLIGDEKGEAQSFLDRLFRAYGHDGVQEAGAEFESRVRAPGERGVRFADLMWKPRVLIEMKRAGTPLKAHYRQAFDYWLHAVPDRPRYVVLCNFDEIWVYDFDSQLDEPVDRVRLDDLSQRWESLAFLLPREGRPVFGNDLVAVTRAAAAGVARVFQSMRARGVPRRDAQRFVLQSVMAMFSEDIGLLPRHSFTEAINDAADGVQAYDLIGSLFREMNTPGTTEGGRYKGTRYFNGGLFAEVRPVEMTANELALMREAAQTNWAEVRPEIFGTLFEGSMDEGERHATGAHFTSQADIAKIVGPCIVEPWRDRIAEAGDGIRKLRGLLHDLMNYRVLDPACGSGNFLYVAYRELKRIEHEITERLRELSPVEQHGFSYVQPENFLGLDVNPFAVEIAKVTMLLGKKLAADELSEDGTVLPLDNLDQSILAEDALFTPWPRADVIIGNPPYLGNRRMTEELGAEYVERLREKFGPRGVADFVTYWYPLAHDHLPEGGRAGFVGTKSVAQGDGRKASLDYIVDNGGAIFDATPLIQWSGEAAVTVSIVNWQKGGTPPPVRTLWLDEGQHPVEVAEISSSLSPNTNLRNTIPLESNTDFFFQGITYGIANAFKIDGATARALVRKEPSAKEVIHPVLGGDELLKNVEINDYVIDIPDSDAGDAYAKYPTVMESLEPTALAYRQNRADKERLANEQKLEEDPGAKVKWPHAKNLNSWWRLWRRRGDLLAAIDGLPRYIALTRTSSELRGPVFSFVDPKFRPSDGVVAFPFSDDYSLGILQSALHTEWFREKCTTLETRLTYTALTVGAHFPWPQNPPPEAVDRVAQAAAAIVDHRAESFRLGVPLARQYDVLRRPGRARLRDLHDELDAAVLEVYGFDPEVDVLAQLLALNHLVAEREKDGEPVTRPGPVHGAGMESTWAFPAPEL